MPRRSKEDHFARVCELYAFDECFAFPSPHVSLSPPLPAFSSPRVSLSPRLPLPAFSSPLVPPSPRPPLSPSLRLALAGFDEAGRGALAGPVTVGCVHFPVLTSGSIPHSVAGRHTNRSITQSFNHSILHSLAGVDDSKRLSPVRREEMYGRITEVASWGVGWASAQEIDRLGIVPAVSLAARRAYSMMGQRVDLLLCDRGLSLLSDLAIESLNHLQPGTPNHPISQSLNHPISQSPNHSISQSLNLSISQSLNYPIPQSLELSFTRGDSRSLHIAAASILAKVARDRLMLDLHQRFPAYGFATNKGYGTPSHLAALHKNGRSAIHRRSFKVKQ